MSTEIQERLNALLHQVKQNIKEITVEEVALLQEKKAPFLLIDVREDKEWDEGHLPNAVHLSRGVLEFQVAGVTEDLNQPIVVYCRGGNRSAFATEKLNELGFKDVKSMTGGFRQWHGAGFRVVKD